MNTDTLQVRIATAKDIDELIITYEEACTYKYSLGDKIWGTDSFTFSEISKMAKQNNTYVVKVNGQHAGAFMLTWKDTYNWGKDTGNDGQAGYIHLLVTRNAFRGQELGKKIIDWVNKFAQEKGRSYVRLDCSYKNRALCEYYKQQGFKEVRRNDDKYPAALYEKAVDEKKFNGAKIALLTDDKKILVYLRDNKPGLYMANKWDLPGGGKEGNETPMETVARETYEEFGITLSPIQVLYKTSFESDRFPGTWSIFMVGKIQTEQINHISFGNEGQKYCFMDIDKYLSLPNAVPHLQEKLKEYLDKQKIAPKGD